MSPRLIAASLTLILLAVGCSSDAEPEPADDPTTTTSTPATTSASTTSTTVAVVPAAGTIDPSLTRDDVDCEPEALNDDEFEFVVAHYVVGGALGAACLGEADATLSRAWEDLSAITPPDQLRDLGLFGGYKSLEDSEEISLAYVNVLSDDGDEFQMSVNLDAYEEDANEARLTMAHEFSHVFTGLASQIDRTNLDLQTCDTFYNGEGCYEDDSLMNAWIQTFWGGGLIDEIDPDTQPTGAEGQDRCDAHPGFFGAYAASSPEEDFAEAFSAYVFRLTPDSDEQQAKLDWLASQPGLQEFQSRAIDANLGPLDNNFDYCG